MGRLYRPLPEQLSDSERRFLERVAPLGLDFLTSRQRYFELFGVRSYHGWRDVIALPEASALSRTPLSFVMYADEQVMDLAPEYLWADYLAHDDARSNHRDMVEQLSLALGPPLVCDVSNCLQCRWDFGVFRVELHTFPPELQQPSNNVLHEQNPRLALCAAVSIHSALAFPYPDGSLEPVADAVRLGGGMVLDVAVGHWGSELGASRRYARRSPRSLAGAVGPGRLLAWRDDANRRLGVSAGARSLVFERAEVAALALRRFQGDRGPGGLRIELELSPARHAPEPATALLEATDPEGSEVVGLQRLAAQIAAHLGLELVRRSDDG
ncbi:hypothetical protein [Kineosporia sp. A_224]|uniref:hypothetical protein n=1 Tax=Kineosporia sp. A_224 TaxID=1962180 RepID=UPI000B4AEA05|nr:hypothetical protein [Kineosporia sp. A_224]